MHLKEIGMKADFNEVDDFTMNCFTIIGRVFNKCRDDKRKQEEVRRQSERRKR